MTSAFAQEDGEPAGYPSAARTAEAPLAEPTPFTTGARPYLGVNVLTAMPFAGGIGGGGWGGGLGVTLAGGYRALPILIGGDLQFAWFGSRAGERRVSEDGAPVTRSVEREDRVIFFDLFLRVLPVTWTVRPYAEFVAGMKFVRGQYTIGGPAVVDGEIDASEAVVASTLGVGAGLEIVLNRNDEDRSVIQLLTIGARWLHGSELPFTQRVARGGETIFVEARFPTTTTMFTLGVAFDVLPFVLSK